MEVNAGIDLKQYVTFKLGMEEYGIDTRKVISIVKMMPITRVPKTPLFMKGVVNLRGEIIPVMDLKLRFNFPSAEDTDNTRIIIVKIEDVLVGMIVDAVFEVLQLSDESIENITSFSNDLTMDYLIGVGKVGDRIVTLLNLDKLIKIT